MIKRIKGSIVYELTGAHALVYYVVGWSVFIYIIWKSL